MQEEYFWTRKRWDEHKRGLGAGDEERWEEKIAGKDAENGEGWDGHEYLPQGTVGCVALDQYGTLCVATSTGGLTNKLAGRIGDTPTFGAGFWAEDWEAATRSSVRILRPPLQQHRYSFIANFLPRGLREALGSCFPTLEGYKALKPEPDLELYAVDYSAKEKISGRNSNTTV